MKLSAILEPLLAAGVDAEVILKTVRAFEAQQEALNEQNKEKARERWRRWKANQTVANVGKRLQTTTNDSCEGVTRGEDNLQTKKISGQEEKKDSAAKPRVDLDAFRAELFPILDTERIDALIAVRRKKGATMTPHAGRLLAKALRQCPNPCAAADEMVLRNWTGIKPEWLESRSSAPRQSTDPPRPPRNAGELSYQQLMGQTDEHTSENDRRLGSGDRDAETPNLGSFQKFAVSGELLRRM